MVDRSSGHRIPMRAALWLVLLVIAAVLAGCGEGEKASSVASNLSQTLSNATTKPPASTSDTTTSTGPDKTETGAGALAALAGAPLPS